MFPTRLAIAVTPLLVALGCSGEEKRSGEGPLATEDGFCAEWAERACGSRVVERCAAPSADACRASQAAFCAALVPAGRYSRDGAADCLKAVEDAYDDAELTAEERNTVRLLAPPCDAVVSGPGGAGDPCTEDGDCAREEDLTCVRKGGAPSGTCQVVQVKGGGFDCTPADVVCDEGFFCDGANCLAARGEGSACSGAAPCAPGLRCVDDRGEPAAGDAGAATTTCQAGASTGATCDEDGDCASGICTLGAAGGVCVATILLSAAEPTCVDLR